MSQIKNEQRPLVTFALLAYNQEVFIREAIEGALSQTYTPLEIILSDDCSNDRTFQEMQEMVDLYNGQHQVILNRNEKNIGIASHVNEIFNMSNGEFIILAAGDDISTPQRTEIFYNYWIKFDKPSVLQSNYVDIDINGNLLQSLHNNNSGSEGINYIASNYRNLVEHVYNMQIKIVGCSAAYSRDVVEKFGPLNNDIIQEDNVFAFRGLLTNGILKIPEVLVKYRKHENNIYNKKYYNNTDSLTFEERENEINYMRKRFYIPKIKSNIKDAEACIYFTNFREEKIKKIIIELKRQLKIMEIKTEWIEKGFLGRITLLVQLAIKYGKLKDLKWGIRRLKL